MGTAIHTTAHCLQRIAALPNEAALALTAIDQTAKPASEGPLHGLNLSVKANIDVQGWVSHAGSAAFAQHPAAAQDAPLVQRLRQQGATILAQSNMTEFAYGALGLNGYFGTPMNPRYPTEARVPGGSSSGAAVAVASGFSDAALCTDTSGSARIPAAFCGVVGFIPTKGLLPEEGIFPLSPSFDVPGIMSRHVQGCQRIFTALAPTHATEVPLPERWTLLIPSELATLGIDAAVQRQFRAACHALTKAGATLIEANFPALITAGATAAEGGMISAEAYSIHQPWLETDGARYDPLIHQRISAGASLPAWRYAQAQHALRTQTQHAQQQLAHVDAVLTPTCPMLAPELAPLHDPETYLATNRRSFSLTEFANRLHLPSLSLPYTPANAHSIGLLLTAKPHDEPRLFALAQWIETLLLAEEQYHDCD